MQNNSGAEYPERDQTTDHNNVYRIKTKTNIMAKSQNQKWKSDG